MDEIVIEGDSIRLGIFDKRFNFYSRCEVVQEGTIECGTYFKIVKLMKKSEMSIKKIVYI